MDQRDDIQSAVNDLALIRRAIEKVHSPTGAPSNRNAIDASLFVQAICLLIAVSLIVYEFVSGYSMTNFMMLSAQDRELRALGLAQVAIAIPLLVMSIYFIAWRAASQSEQSFQDYLTRNFQYLRNLTFLSDVLVKLIPLSFLVLAKHPEWISPLLSLYIADYLIQGRFFTLPIKTALALGIASMLLAGAQYLVLTTELVWPLIHFASVTIISVIYLVRSRADAKSTLVR